MCRPPFAVGVAPRSLAQVLNGQLVAMELLHGGAFGVKVQAVGQQAATHVVDAACRLDSLQMRVSVSHKAAEAAYLSLDGGPCLPAVWPCGRVQQFALKYRALGSRQCSKFVDAASCLGGRLLPLCCLNKALTGRQLCQSECLTHTICHANPVMHRPRALPLVSTLAAGLKLY